VNKTDNAVSKSENNLFNGEWNHVVAIRDFENQTTAMYINGMLIKKVENIKTIGIGEDHRPLEIGNSAEDKSYRDLLDEFKMYNYALSDADVWRLFQQNVPVAKATNGVPAHEGTDVDHTELTLSWEGTEEAYNVYLGSSPENMPYVTKKSLKEILGPSKQR
jgi:hypothetical protein